MVDDPFATAERRMLRDVARRFTEREIVPHLADWERAGEVPRSLHQSAAKVGLLGIGYPERIGGAGGDSIDLMTVTEAMIEAGASSGVLAALYTHGIALPHLIAAGRDDLIERYARPTLAGDLIGCLAITEPDGGSDVAAIRTRAVRQSDQSWIVNGSKTFITSGARADFVTAAVRTGGPGHGGVSLMVIDSDLPGFTVTRRLDKMGWLCSDTAELSFADVAAPADRLIGAEGSGFAQIMRAFAGERLSLAVHAYAIAQRCVDLTLAYVRQRETFARPLLSRQVIRHRLAEMARVTDVARTYVRQAAIRVAGGESSMSLVAMAKNTAVAACDYVVDQAVQLHGGAGYLRETEVERHYRDARILGIGGGTSEIMNEIIARELSDGPARRPEPPSAV